VQISIRVEGLENVVKLSGIPDGARFVITNAIRVALGRGRTEADRAIRSRFAIRQKSVLASISKPWVSGLYGMIHSQGKRLMARDFLVVRDENPSGVAVQWIKGRTIRYPSAFLKGGVAHGIMQRQAKAGRYPLKFINPPFSIPEALESQKILPQVEKTTEEALYQEMDRLMNYILSTGSVPRSRWR
jgi:hypothetical protein